MKNVTDNKDNNSSTKNVQQLALRHVYKTRVEMEKAVSILKADAISLDGGVVSRKGILPLGHWWI
ncbi:hypothetical protein EJ110_NYTH44956 [Nymphaea thermarum]|nr:hypothetical protein EJ110_NYTH44956 [Nymphaea thermarum]